MAQAKSSPLQTVMGVFVFCELACAFYALHFSHHKAAWFFSLVAAIPIFAAFAGNLISNEPSDKR